MKKQGVFLSELDYYTIEIAATGAGFWKTGGNSRRSDSYAAAIRQRDLGRLEFVRAAEHPKDKFVYFKPTLKGLLWWYGRRVEEYEKEYARPEMAEAWSGMPGPEKLLEFVEGKGIGSEFALPGSQYAPAVFRALRDGLFELVHYYDYSGMAHGLNEHFTVRYTAKGMQYYDSLPRLVLECA